MEQQTHLQQKTDLFDRLKPITDMVTYTLNVNEISPIDQIIYLNLLCSTILKTTILEETGWSEQALEHRVKQFHEQLSKMQESSPTVISALALAQTRMAGQNLIAFDYLLQKALGGIRTYDSDGV